MNIKIGDYVLTSDSENIILRREKIRGEDSKVTGESYFETVGYYANITQAVQAIEGDHIKGSDATTLKELLDGVKEFRQIVALALEGV